MSRATISFIAAAPVAHPAATSNAAPARRHTLDATSHHRTPATSDSIMTARARLPALTAHPANENGDEPSPFALPRLKRFDSSDRIDYLAPPATARVPPLAASVQSALNRSAVPQDPSPRWQRSSEGGYPPLPSFPQFRPSATTTVESSYPLLDDPDFAEASCDSLDSFDNDDGALPPIDVPVTTVARRTKLTRKQALQKVAEVRARAVKNRAAAAGAHF
eukprot:CAMPEP_0174841684 /NCGR_PEP_ID=MMETSP1114-20130205/9470_1 /TAXON_ID=312471 /ORGANISM="Neobodo designis, Strain CCAP 1951/1" /LENGTH=219 /DNA_ID=CAMNT_0016075877 /DNA_START=91 /DNA_END=750 /DNA_ORIENTATION=+